MAEPIIATTVGMGYGIGESIKAMKPVTDSLLEYKLKELRTWLKERHLNKQLDEDKLDKFFFPYYKRVFKKVSSIKTIVFPHIEIKINDIFEPLFLENKNQWGASGEQYSPDKLFNKSSSIIIDDAGMGKTTYVKFITVLAITDTNLIPIFIELRTLGENFNLLDELRKELDSINELFDEALFLKLLSLEKFLIILDGFDEVSLEKQPEMAKQISYLSIKSEAIIILTSRPEAQLPGISNSNTFKFSPLTLEQAKSLLIRYDAIGQTDVGERLIKEVESVPTKFLETPLLLSLLYRTYGFNNSIASKISTFYDEIYIAMYKGHDLTKKGYVREKKSLLDFEEFRKLLRAFSFTLLSSKKENMKSYSEAINYIEKAIKLSKVTPSSPSNFFNDLLSSVPLMYKDGLDYKFMHRTIMEFFAAEFIAYSDNATEMADKVFKSKIASSFNKSFDYLEELKPNLFKKIIVYEVAKKYIEHNENYFDIQNDILKTHLFKYDAGISVWQRNKVETFDIKTKQHDLHINYPTSLPFSASSMRFIYGNIGSEEYIVTVAQSGLKQVIPSSTEKYLTKYITKEIMQPKEYEFDAFVESFEIGKWYNIDNHFIKENISNKLLFELMNEAFLAFSTSVFDEEKSIQLIKEVDDYIDDSEIIDTLLNI